MYERGKNSNEKEKRIVQFFLSCTTSIPPHARSRAIARRSPFSLSGTTPCSSTHVCDHRREKHFPWQSHAYTILHMSIIAPVALKDLLRRSILPGYRRARIFFAIEKQRRMKVSRHAKTNRQHVRLEERRVHCETAAGSYRTAATTAMPPRRRLKRRRRGREPRLRPPHHGNLPADRSPLPSLSVTYTTPVSPAWYVDVHPADDASGVREQLSLLRVNRGDDDFSSRCEINGESTLRTSQNFTMGIILFLS